MSDVDESEESCRLIWMSQAVLETVYIARIDVSWMNREVLGYLETVYIARNDVLWMNIEVSSYIETV